MLDHVPYKVRMTQKVETNEARSITFVVDSGRILKLLFVFCVSIELLLVLLDLWINWQRASDSGAIRRLFNITREDGLASWFAVTQTIFVAIGAWIMFAIIRSKQNLRKRAIGWLVVALFFSYMAVDDGAKIHERLGSAFKQFNDLGGFPSYAWQMILAPVFVVMGVVIFFFLWKELSGIRDRFTLFLALGCFALAVVMDFVEGMGDVHRDLAQLLGSDGKTVKHFSKSIEEFIEMLGMTLFLLLFLGQVTRQVDKLSIQFLGRRNQ